ncbi:hypothetical protein ACDQ55_11245 [Chitinophaga sp. 30R24]|uniref:hypothetical protein n=1 Tax=Chitinophaga sp. 30R24 TaxID=3248838 RepID=UPI003B8EF361
MKKILFLFLVAGLFYACKKESIGAKPFISFKQYSTDSVAPETEAMEIVLNIKDGNGDIEDSIWVASFFERGDYDSTYYPKKMPSIGANKGSKVTGEVSVLLSGTDLKFHQSGVNDSIHFKIFVRDNAGNYSDTIVTPKIPYQSQ